MLIGKEVLFPPCAVGKRHAEELHENVIEEQDDGERADEVQQYADRQYDEKEGRKEKTHACSF